MLYLLAQNNRMHRVHAPLASSQPPNLHICIISSLFNLLVALALHLLSHFLVHLHYLCNSLLLSMCFTLSLEPVPCCSPSTSFQSLHLWLTSSYACHIIFRCWFTTLIIHISLTFTPVLKPFSFTNPSHWLYGPSSKQYLLNYRVGQKTGPPWFFKIAQSKINRFE